MTTSEVLISKSVNDLQKELAEALTLIAEKEKEVGRLKDIGNRLMESGVNEWSSTLNGKGKWSVVVSSDIVSELKQALADYDKALGLEEGKNG